MKHSIHSFNKTQSTLLKFMRKKRCENWLIIGLGTSQLGWHPPNYETYALLNLDNTLLKLAKLEKMHT